MQFRRFESARCGFHQRFHQGSTKRATPKHHPSTKFACRRMSSFSGSRLRSMFSGWFSTASVCLRACATPMLCAESSHLTALRAAQPPTPDGAIADSAAGSIALESFTGEPGATAACAPPTFSPPPPSLQMSGDVTATHEFAANNDIGALVSARYRACLQHILN